MTYFVHNRINQPPKQSNTNTLFYFITVSNYNNTIFIKNQNEFYISYIKTLISFILRLPIFNFLIYKFALRIAFSRNI